MATNSHGIRILDRIGAHQHRTAANDTDLGAEFRRLVRDRDAAGVVRFMSSHPDKVEPILRDGSVAGIPFRIGSHRYVKMPAMAEAAKWSVELDAQSWAPWLRYTPEMIMLMMKLFPAGQVMLKDRGGRFIAGLNTIRVDWDGSNSTLPHLVDLVRNANAFERSYNPDGNTLFMVKMSVAHDQRGSGLPSRCIDMLKEAAIMLGVSNLAGAFRPSGFGRYKSENGPYADFARYSNARRSDGLPVDPWLRNLVRNGMIPVGIDRLAMAVLVPIGKFDEYRRTHKAEWMQFGDRWECGETGAWKVARPGTTAVYVESRVWGRIPLQ